MRLIDADAMLKRNEHSIYDITDLKEMLHYEPTAYDVDKVIEQLKRLQEDGIPTRSAIHFVKRGGLDE